MPARSTRAISSGAHPPSGPTSRSSRAARRRSGGDRRVRIRRQHQSRDGRGPFAEPALGAWQLHALRERGLRPHCSHAATAIWRQWARRLPPRSPSGTRALRAVNSGWIAATPSSTDLRTAWSIASLAAMPWTSVTASAGLALDRIEAVDAHYRVALACSRQRGGEFTSGAGEQCHAVPDRQPQHAQCVMRGRSRQDIVGAHVAGDGSAGAVESRRNATGPPRFAA